MFIAVTTVMAVFIIFLFALSIGWRSIRARENHPASHHPPKKISVVVAARNEENNIGRLLNDLATQTYDNYEVIVVDDHSHDRTSEVVTGFGSAIRLVQNPGIGKKAALSAGIANASGEIIATTDADCRVRPGWIPSIADRFSPNTQMVAGPVVIEGWKDLFTRLQQLEFASLVGASGAAIALGVPIMCNGANLAFRKKTFEEVNGYEGNFHIASGDDEFLMRKIHTRYPESIQFNADPGSVVHTRPQQDLNDFFQQRLRWAGKWRTNSSAMAVFIAFLVLITQFSVLLSLFYFFTTGNFFWLIPALVKALVEAWVLHGFCSWLKIQWHWMSFFLLLLLYPFYVVVTGIAATFLGFKWKERSYKS